ncbi:hypothetical protein ACF0H5_004219 [Mactra antiquata]
MILFQDDIWTRRNMKSEDNGSRWMLPKLRRNILIIFMVIILMYLMIYSLLPEVTRERKLQSRLHNRTLSSKNTSSNSFLVNMPFCKIPFLDPYDPSIKHIVKKTLSLECPKNLSLTFQEGFYVKINQTVAKMPPFNGQISYCTYTPLYRPRYEITHNNYLRYLSESSPFHDSVKIDHEFVKVNCYNNEDKSVYVNFYGFIQHVNQSINASYDKQFRRHIERDKIKERLNVIMIGMDSVSRLSFIRQMLKSRAFLENELESFDMMGYNKVADNTFINIVPMTMGKFVHEMPWGDNRTNLTFDGYDFLWKQFSDKGYRTFYAEDAPDIAIFDFLKGGFKTPPTDHFNRPVSVAMEMKEQNWYNNHHCFQDRLETDIVLKYLSDFIETYQHDPFFAFTFITRLSHDSVNSAGAADESYFKFFTNLHKKNLIRNSVMFFFSDHGMRFGNIRETHIGKMEERLPFMQVVIPKWLGKKYPEIKNVLKVNQNRLSTPFDVYETVKDILYFDGFIKASSETSRGVSWFKEIPFGRSCEQAGILPHWCTCKYHKKLSVSDPVVVKSSSILLEEIKHELRDYSSICEDLTLYNIREAEELMDTDGIDDEWISYRKVKASRDIQVVIETMPGKAVFEGTVRIDKDNGVNEVVGDISRITIYGHQADCINVFKLKKYCQCKKSR